MKLRIGLGIGLNNRGVSGPSNPITGTGPVLDAMTDGDMLDSAVTWGTYEPVGAVATKQMRLGEGEWIAYLDTETAADDEWQVREVVDFTDAEDVEFARTYTSALQIVLDIAPVAANALADQFYTLGDVDQTVDASVDFTGTRLVFSLISPPAGVTINASTGVVTTSPAEELTAASVVVRATNSADAADSAFSVTVAEAVVAPEFTAFDLDTTDPEASVLEATLTQPATIYWAAFADELDATAANIVSGDEALLSGSFVVEFAETDEPIDLSTLVGETFFFGAAPVNDNGTGSPEVVEVSIAGSEPAIPYAVATESGTGTTVTIPASVASGDLIIIWADNQNGVSPAVATGFTSIWDAGVGNSRLRPMSRAADGAETTVTVDNAQRWVCTIYRHASGAPTVGNHTVFTGSAVLYARIPANTAFEITDGTSIAIGAWHRRSNATQAMRDETVTGMVRRASLPASGNANSIWAGDSDGGATTFAEWTSTNVAAGNASTIGMCIEIRSPAP